MSEQVEHSEGGIVAHARWFPLYLSLVATLVLSPLAVSQWPREWSAVVVPTDVILNVLVFLPFGCAMRRGPIWRVTLAAFLFSGGLEWLQVYLLRTPSAWDVVSNTLGAVVGARLPLTLRVTDRITPRTRPGGIATIVVALVLIGVVARQVRRTPATDFSNWQLVPFSIGAEEIGEPLWEGVLRKVLLYDRRIDLRGVAPTDTYRDGGPILVLNFTGPAIARLDGPAGSTSLSLHPDSSRGFLLSARGLTLGPGRWLLPDTIARHVVERARATSAISIVAEIIPAPEPQQGIRRLFALSAGAGDRDFSVTQRAGQILVRARSPYFGTDGDARAVAIGPAGAPMTVTAAIDRHWFSVKTDRGAVVEEYLPMRVMPWLLGTEFTLTYAMIVVLMMLGASTLAPHGYGVRAAVMAACAALVCLLLWATNVFDRHAMTAWNIALPPIVWFLACVYLTGHSKPLTTR